MILINNFSRGFELDLIRLCRNSPYGSRIISYHTAYHGRKYNFLDFWIQYNDLNKAECAFCKYYSTLIICGTPCDTGEVCDFIQMLSPAKILCDSSLDINLNIPFVQGETMMCKSLSDVNLCSHEIVRLSSDMLNLKKVYALLREEEDLSVPLPDFEEYFLDISHRIRHGVSEVYAIFDDKENIVSTASLIAKSDSSSVIGCVATSTRKRCKGLATSLVYFITQKEIDGGKSVYLHREKFISIYERLGFETVGNWKEYTFLN